MSAPPSRICAPARRGTNSPAVTARPRRIPTSRLAAWTSAAGPEAFSPSSGPPATGQPCAGWSRIRRQVFVARVTDEALGARAGTDAAPAPAGSGDAALVRAAVASGDVGDIKSIDNFSSATEPERVAFLDHLAHQTWAGPRDEAAMVRI